MSVRDFIPPILNSFLRKIRREKYGWFGNYATWQDALRDSTGYDSTLIVEKVKDALIQVREGKAAFERDSVLFDQPEYNWPVVGGLLWVAAQHGGKLNVIDFGGSLGSTFFQNRTFLNDLDLQWNIVEQANFVEYGKKYFEDDKIRFHSTLATCFTESRIDVVVLSSVLPYLQEPYNVLREIFEENPPVIIFDKMPFALERDEDIITIQRVHPSIYNGSYPAWFFNEKKFKNFINTQYNIIAEFSCPDKANIPSVFKGMIVQAKNKEV